MPNKWHPDASVARSAQFIDANGNLIAQPPTSGQGSIRKSDDTSASVLLIIFPTADPHVVGAVWNNAGTLTISAG